MGGVRLGGTAILPPTLGLPITVYSLNDYLYLAMAGRGTNIELTDKTVDYFDDGSNPILSPDGTLIALDGDFPGPNGEGQIFTVPVAGGVPTVVSPDDAGGPWMLTPNWRPDSGGLIYIHADPTEGYNGSIVSVDLSNPGVETVLYTPSVVGAPNGYGPYRPTYSPDGNYIAFNLNDEAGATATLSGLYVMDADGSNVLQLATWSTAGPPNDGYGFEGSQFCWLPDSSGIVYTRRSFGTFPTGYDGQVHVVNVDGTGDTTLTTDGETSVQNNLVSDRGMSPDGTFAVISSFRTADSAQRIYRLELDGSGATLLNASHGPAATEYFRGCYVHGGRIWFIPVRGLSPSPVGVLASMAMDGSDYQVECTLGTDLDGDEFYPGSGIVFP